MNKLTAVCGVPSVDGMSLEQLRECMSYSQAFGVNPLEWMVLAVAAVLGMRVAVFGRKAPLAALEGLVYAPLAAYGGMVGGLLFAQWLPPWMMGAWLFFVAAAALVLWIIGLAKGTADAGWKVLGSIELLVFAAALITVGVLCFTIPETRAAAAYERYLTAVTWLFTAVAVMDALFVATHSSYHWGVGWLLVPINASWGALGNLMGLVHHLVSWNLFKDQGGIEQDNQKFYTRYKDGIRLRFTPAFAFTQAAVMTSPPVEKHESQHVLQHFIFGPIFTVSYLLWMIPASIIGLVVGLIMGKGINGVEAWAYYNNPWEIWAYAIEGGRSQDGDADLIWGPVASWLVAVIYYLLAIGAFVLLLAWRH